MKTLEFIAAWAEAHPALMTAVAWPFVLGIVTVMFKPRSPEEYAAIAQNWPRLAATLQLIGALGVDPVKVTKALKKIVLPRGPSALIVVLIAAPTLSGCAWWAKHGPTVLDLITDNVMCVMGKPDVPIDRALAECSVREENAPKVVEIVSAHRRQVAAARTASAPMCGDAGVP